MQRIAVPMIGGMVSSTLLTSIVIPAIYGVVKGGLARKADALSESQSFGLARSSWPRSDRRQT
jgi:Cu(I)/Ag(I) efflux system membrane protein CusA/SilA